MLEEKTFQLYSELSQKTENTLAKSSFHTIATESQNHSKMLKQASERFSSVNLKEKDCKKALRETWDYVVDLIKAIKNKDSFNSEELLKLSKRLALIESNYVEEYSIMTKLKTLQYMSKEISTAYTIDLNEIKNILDPIIADEESHQRILYELNEALTEIKNKTQKQSLLHFPASLRR
jgi:hypothetical protein